MGATLLCMAAYTTVQPGYGDQYNNEAIAGCVMGGTSMAGGLGIYQRYSNWCVYHRSAYRKGFWLLAFQKIISLLLQVLLLSSQYSVTYLQDAERTNFSSILRDQLYE